MSVLFFQNKFSPKVKYGPNYDLGTSFISETGVAFEGEGGFFAMSINFGGNTHFMPVSNPPGISLREWVLKSFGDNSPTEHDTVPGVCYKRIWRPAMNNYRNPQFEKTISQEELTQSSVSLQILLDKMEDLFEFLEPNQKNQSAYGHKIREIILLACMEVESAWSAVLRENGYTSAQDFNTKDYIKLLKPMFLDGYKLSLQQYPQFPAFSPFENWNSAAPTQSLVWYDDYNKIKHDREKNLHLATLQNAIASVGAAAIMFRAQFGYNIPYNWTQQPKPPFIASIFKLDTSDGFKKYEKDFYISKLGVRQSGSNVEIDHVPAQNWTVENYKFN
jgi:hypothetical protein